MQFYHLGMGGSTFFFLLRGAVCHAPSTEIYEQSLSSTPSDTVVSDHVTLEYGIYSTATQDSDCSERAPHVINSDIPRQLV